MNNNLYEDIRSVINNSVLYKFSGGSPTKDIIMKYVKEAGEMLKKEKVIKSDEPAKVLLKAQALVVAVDKKNDNVQSVGAILRTKPEEVERIFKKAKSEDLKDDFHFELNFLMTNEDHREKGLATRIIQNLLSMKKPETTIYTVISDERLGNRLINRHGFQQMGEFKEKGAKKYLLGLVEEG